MKKFIASGNRVWTWATAVIVGSSLITCEASETSHLIDAIERESTALAEASDRWSRNFGNLNKLLRVLEQKTERSLTAEEEKRVIKVIEAHLDQGLELDDLLGLMKSFSPESRRSFVQERIRRLRGTREVSRSRTTIFCCQRLIERPFLRT